MDVTLLVSKKTYSLSKHKPIVEWRVQPYSIDSIKMPRDFEIRLVKAAAGKSLDKKFNELRLDWSASIDAKAAAKKLICGNSYLGGCSGLTDVALYIENLGLAVIVESHASSSSIIEVDSIDALKKALD